MSQKKQLNIVIKYAVILALFTSLAGLILSIAYTNTYPKKLANAAKIKKEAQKEVVATATHFKEETISKNIFIKAFDEDEQLVGYIIEASNQGYSSVIKMLVGIDLNYNIIGLKILSQAETPGLGTGVEKTSFTEQFFNKNGETLFLDKDGGEINAITGATISSRAVLDGVKLALENFKELIKEQE